MSAVSLVLGVMMSLAWINDKNRRDRLSSVDPDVRQMMADQNFKPYLELKKLNGELQKVNNEVTNLRQENTKLQNAMVGNGKQSQVLNDALQQVKLLAGLTDVEGPGLTVTLRDSEKSDLGDMDRIIHDTDVLRVVNELWACTAEAVEVNGHRIGPGTSIRCAGPVIYIDGSRVSSPIAIRAIGDPDTLIGGMRLPGGVLDDIRGTDNSMVSIDKVAKHRFKAYSGPTARHFLTVPKESK